MTLLLSNTPCYNVKYKVINLSGKLLNVCKDINIYIYLFINISTTNVT